MKELLFSSKLLIQEFDLCYMILQSNVWVLVKDYHCLHVVYHFTFYLGRKIVLIALTLPKNFLSF